jgi:hypothetical protein
MARRSDAKNIGIQLTPSEWQALESYARLIKRDKATVIRAALATFIPKFPTNAWEKDRQDAKD